MHVKVLLFKGLERYINLYMYSLLHVLLSILIDTIYCYIILCLVYMYVPRTISKMVPPCSHLVATRYSINPNPDYLHKSSGKFTTFTSEAVP